LADPEPAGWAGAASRAWPGAHVGEQGHAPVDPFRGGKPSLPGRQRILRMRERHRAGSGKCHAGAAAGGGPLALATVVPLQPDRAFRSLRTQCARLAGRRRRPRRHPYGKPGPPQPEAGKRASGRDRAARSGSGPGIQPDDIDDLESDCPGLKRFATAADEFATHVGNNMASIPNNKGRGRYGEPISTSFGIMSAVNQGQRMKEIGPIYRISRRA
jgi:hypothetical protein